MIGTPGFVGARLTEAREARAMPAAVFAELIGVSHAAILQYESGKTSPRPEVMRLISEKLNLPEGFFKRHLDPLDEGADDVVWRSLASVSRAVRRRCARKMLWMQDVTRYIRHYLVLPEVKIPDFGVNNPANLKAKDIEVLATQVREEWGLGIGPIADVTLLLENNGVIVSRMRFGADGIDAYCRWSGRDGAPYMVLGADKSSAVRSRLDAAHELGHLVLHRKRGALGQKALEEQAFRFASAFLVPEQSFIKELWAPSLDAFRSLKDRWLVSIAAMIKRCYELDIIDDDQYQRMCINHTRRGWRLVEPLDESLRIERPRLLRRSVEMLVNEGMRSKHQILHDLPYAGTDLEEIAGLPRDYFSDLESDVRPLPRVVRFPSGTAESEPE